MSDQRESDRTSRFVAAVRVAAEIARKKRWRASTPNQT